MNQTEYKREALTAITNTFQNNPWLHPNSQEFTQQLANWLNGHNAIQNTKTDVTRYIAGGIIIRFYPQDQEQSYDVIFPQKTLECEHAFTQQQHQARTATWS